VGVSAPSGVYELKAHLKTYDFEIAAFKATQFGENLNASVSLHVGFHNFCHYHSTIRARPQCRLRIGNMQGLGSDA